MLRVATAACLLWVFTANVMPRSYTLPKKQQIYKDGCSGIWGQVKSVGLLPNAVLVFVMYI